jgi:hypothetical protein
MARQLGGDIVLASGGSGSITTLANGNVVSGSDHFVVAGGQTLDERDETLLSSDGTVIGSQMLASDPFFDTSSTLPDSFAALPNGNFAAVVSEGNGTVVEQIHDPNGVPLGSPVTLGSGGGVDTATLSNGNIVATWETNTDVRAAILNPDGSVSTAGFPVTTDGTLSSVASLAGGGFAVTWDGIIGGSGAAGLNAQLFNSVGQATSASFVVTPQTMSVVQPFNDSVGLANGNYVIAWGGAGGKIDAQIYNGTNPVGSPLTIGNAGEGAENPRLAALGDGDFVVTWTGLITFQSGGNSFFYTVAHAQVFHPDGTPFGAEVTTSGGVADVSALGADRFVMNVGGIATGVDAGARIFGSNDDASHSELIQNRSTGELDFLSGNGATLTQSAVGPDLWPVVAQGDFNNDGQTDLVTQENGHVDFVFMRDAQVIGSDLQSGSYWHVAGSAYFSFLGGFSPAGGPELISQSASSGQIDLLEFENGSLTHSLLLNGNYDNVVGAGDFNGDGNTEIVTQNSAGQIDLLTFNVLTGELTRSALLPGSFWTVKGVADVNHDGKADLITQNDATGQIDYLMLNGGQVTGSLLENTAVPGWSVVNASQVADQFLHNA